jgi:hypothetical protein
MLSWLTREAKPPAYRELRAAGRSMFEKVILTDINLCASLQRRGAQVLLFLRLLEVDGIFMSSGLSFRFEFAQTDRLLQSFGQKMKKVAPADWSQRKFAFFYQKYKEWGREQGYADVPAV